MSEIAQNIESIKKELPLNVTLVAVSKTKPKEVIEEAYNAGQKDFGENKVQELVEKSEVLAKDIRWHLLGHLQTNKVKYIVPFVHLIHSADSIKLLKEINKECKKIERTVNVLLQVHIADEETKYGFHPSEIMNILDQNILQAFEYINVVGLMGMATFTDDAEKVRSEFRQLSGLFNEINIAISKAKNRFENIKMDILSMGMSGDYLIAVEEGSTMVRIGTSIFGNRNYSLS